MGNENVKNIGINIGHDKDFGIKINEIIMDILNSSNAEAVKIAALETIKKASDISYLNVTNCNINMEETK